MDTMFLQKISLHSSARLHGDYLANAEQVQRSETPHLQQRTHRCQTFRETCNLSSCKCAPRSPSIHFTSTQADCQLGRSPLGQTTSSSILQLPAISCSDRRCGRLPITSSRITPSIASIASIPAASCSAGASIIKTAAFVDWLLAANNGVTDCEDILVIDRPVTKFLQLTFSTILALHLGIVTRLWAFLAEVARYHTRLLECIRRLGSTGSTYFRHSYGKSPWLDFEALRIPLRCDPLF